MMRTATEGKQQASGHTAGDDHRGGGDRQRDA
jgi:hypothetical protein